MLIITILVGAFLLLLVLFCIVRNRTLQKQLKEKQLALHELESVTDILYQNVDAYILLIDKDFFVLQTNFYHHSNLLYDKTPKRVGELLRCRNALDAGACGEHGFCKICPIRLAINKAYKEKGEFSNVEAVMRLYVSEEKKSYVDCEIAASGKYFSMGGKEGMFLTMHDISKLKKIQRELIVAKEQAEASDKLKSAFLANMSHEIRTPLNAIVGFAPLLADVTDHEEKESYIEIIHTNSELLLQLINDILDLSKIEAGILEFVYSDVDVYAMMKDMEYIFKMRMESKDSPIEICFENQSALDIIYTERNRLSQVISNFLTNSVKFTEKGRITFGYKVRESDIYFYVTDTGAGIAKENLGEIFKRFTKLDVKKKGTGLGLAISKMIIEKLKGEIGVESDLGKGATFWFTLPVKSIHKELLVSETKDKLHQKIEPENHLEGKLKTILIAEDMEDNYLLYEAFLGKKYQLVHAWNGEEAIDLFLKKEPDAVIMDIRMPLMDGYQAMEAIRRISAKVPVIAATAFAFEEDRRKVMESGFDGYIAKPIKADVLYSKLEEIGI